MAQGMKLPVPRTHIRKIFVVCIRCSGGVRTILSTPLAYGYMRRHRCRVCTETFYSLAPFNSKEVEISPLPFADRALTDYELEQRRLMWDESETQVVTLKSNDQTIMRLIEALKKKESSRNTHDAMLAKAYDVMKRIVQQEEIDNARE